MKSVTQWYKQSPIADLAIGALPAAGLYYWLLYQTDRADFSSVATLWMLAFALYLWWIIGKNKHHHSPSRIKYGIGLGIALRILATFSLPILSDDYFRFLWDGQLLLEGVNPFTILPSQLAEDTSRLIEMGLSEEWFTSLNSPDYFTIYPPVLQAIFMLGASLGSLKAGVILMKVIVLIGEIVSLLLLKKILTETGKKQSALLWYALNPLVIVELCGSLHFEALMITLMLAALWLFIRKKEIASAIFLGLAISTKLLPLIFLPFLLKQIGFWRSLRYGLIAGGVTLLLFSPLLTEEMLNGFQESLTLYLNRFEFNAGLWYLIRAIGFDITGWNPIREIGPFLTPLAAALILYIALLEWRPSRIEWARSMMYALTIYFFFSLIVHPWYITTLVALAVLTEKRYALLWSCWLPWTYLAYQSDPVSESMWLIGLEYGSVLLFLIVENIAASKRVDLTQPFRSIT